jgi:hypothetical protein
MAGPVSAVLPIGAVRTITVFPMFETERRDTWPLSWSVSAGMPVAR